MLGAVNGVITDDDIAAAMERAIDRLCVDRAMPQRRTLIPNDLSHVLASADAAG